MIDKLKRLFFHLKNNPNVVAIYMLVNFGGWIPDYLYVKLVYRLSVGVWPNLSNPVTLGEKLQWLKLYNHKPVYSIMADKVRMKDFAKEIIGEEYIVPTLGVWDDPDDIDFSLLPEQFVLKCNHNSGTGMFICEDKSLLDEKVVRANLKKGLRENYFKIWREWSYKDIKRKIIGEVLLKTTREDGELLDYKFWCCDGTPIYCQILSNKTHEVSVYDMDWNKVKDLLIIDKKYSIYRKSEIERPIYFEQMKDCASKLSKGVPFLRVDFYETDKLYLGELTFYPTGGWGNLNLKEHSDRLASMIKISFEK